MCLLRVRERRECDSNGHELINQKVRLHITPLSPELLSAVLASHTAHLADNISYHTLETFPENNYGYLELPPMEAEKLKKKLNGSILKSKKDLVVTVGIAWLDGAQNSERAEVN